MAKSNKKIWFKNRRLVEGESRGPKDAERYFALLKVNKINFDEPEKGKK